MKKKYDDRLSLVRRLLDTKKCSHVLVTNIVDGEYLSGFHASNIFLLISRTNNLLFTDFRYKEAADAFCRDHPSWRFILTGENGLSVLPSHCAAGSVIGVQSNSMSIDEFDALTRRLRKGRLVKLGDAVSLLFIQKSALEIKMMKKAAHIGDRAFQRSLPQLKSGMSERDAASMIEHECRCAGSEKPSFDTIVLFGERTALPHGRPTDARLKKGDLVLMDFGCSLEGFCSDMTRTVVAGAANGRQREIYRIVAEAQKRARDKAGENVKASAVDASARDIIEKAGYGAYFGHATGHGIGRTVHERPRIARNSNAVLPSGAVITIEPGIYIPRFGGIRIEDMVVVQKSGGETITESPRRLMEIHV
jgi:Xaa-Pro aminopeptidase